MAAEFRLTGSAARNHFGVVARQCELADFKTLRQVAQHGFDLGIDLGDERGVRLGADLQAAGEVPKCDRIGLIHELDREASQRCGIAVIHGLGSGHLASITRPVPRTRLG